MNLNFLLPKQSIFFDYFNQLSNRLLEMAALLREFNADFTHFEDYARRAKDIEHRADAITHQIVDTLNRTVITPFDREDIHDMTDEIDDVIDLIENVIHNIFLYRITYKVAAVNEFARIIPLAAEELAKLMQLLGGQRYTPEVQALVERIHSLEDEADVAFQNGIVDLFEHERDPVTVIKWKDLLENLEDVMDKCQDVSSVIEGLLIKAG